MDNESMNNESMNNESMNNESMNNESMNNESMNNDKSTNNESLNNESMNNLQQKILDTNIELLNLQKSRPNIGKYFLYFLLIVVIYLLFQVLSIIISYRSIFDWWKNNGGKDYDNFVNIFAIMSSYKSIIIYWLLSIFGNIFTKLDRGQIMFLTDIVLKNSVTVVDNVRSGFVQPRHVAKDIRFAREDGDILYNNWLDNDVNEVKSYPNPVDYPGWIARFIKWGIPAFNTSPDTSFVVPDYTTSSKTPQQANDEWFNIKLHPDNFLARYGIAVDCPLILCFINNNYTTNGVIIRASSMTFLMGGGSVSNPGGWVGWMQSLEGDNISRAGYTDLIFSHLEFKPITKDDSALKCNVAGSILGGIGEMAGAAALGPMILPLEAFPYAAPFLGFCLAMVVVSKTLVEMHSDGCY